MKKSIAILVCLVMTISFTACEQGETAEFTREETEVTTVAENEKTENNEITEREDAFSEEITTLLVEKTENQIAYEYFLAAAENPTAENIEAIIGRAPDIDRDTKLTYWQKWWTFGENQSIISLDTYTDKETEEDTGEFMRLGFANTFTYPIYEYIPIEGWFAKAHFSDEVVKQCNDYSYENRTYEEYCEEFGDDGIIMQFEKNKAGDIVPTLYAWADEKGYNFHAYFTPDDEVSLRWEASFRERI